MVTLNQHAVGKTSKSPFPKLVGLWTAIKNQEPWEPTFLVGYTLPPENAYGSIDNVRPAPKPAYLEVRPVVIASTAAASATAASAAALAVRAEAAR